MSVFSSSITHRSFWWQISTLCFVLGLLLAAATFTATQINRAGVGSGNPALSYGLGIQIAVDKAAQSDTEIKKLRDKVTELETKLARGDDASMTLNKELQSTKFLAGLTEAVGPGIQIILNDALRSTATALPEDPINADNYIHDEDIARVVNELKASGAEAVTVNGQRVGGTTAIRCVGPVVHINFVPAAPPYVIQAIGDPEALFNGMNLPRGVLDGMRRTDPRMVQMEKKTLLKLPAFAGSTQPRFARPPKAPEKDTGKDSSDNQERTGKKAEETK